MKYCAAYYSDIGIQKETNQDSLLLVQRGQTQDDEAIFWKNKILYVRRPQAAKVSPVEIPARQTLHRSAVSAFR